MGKEKKMTAALFISSFFPPKSEMRICYACYSRLRLFERPFHVKDEKARQTRRDTFLYHKSIFFPSPCSSHISGVYCTTTARHILHTHTAHFEEDEEEKDNNGWLGWVGLGWDPTFPF